MHSCTDSSDCVRWFAVTGWMGAVKILKVSLYLQNIKMCVRLVLVDCFDTIWCHTVMVFKKIDFYMYSIFSAGITVKIEFWNSFLSYPLDIFKAFPSSKIPEVLNIGVIKYCLTAKSIWKGFRIPNICHWCPTLKFKMHSSFNHQ